MSYAWGTLTSGNYGWGTLSENPDITLPVIYSVSIIDNTLRMRVSEEVVVNDGSGLALTLSGGACTATYSTGTGTRNLIYTLSRTPAVDETGTYDYTQPGDGIEDIAGNDLESVVGGSLSVLSLSGNIYEFTSFSSAFFMRF